jgi:hypothetical protein
MAVKKCQVVSVGQNKTEIKGKPVDQIIIVLRNLEKGSEKKEFIPSFNKVYSAAAVLQTGDLVNAVWEKKTVGDKDYFNLTQLTKTGTESIGIALKQTVIPSTAGGFKGKDPDVQTSIARQNVNNVAMQFVTKMLEQGLYPKKSTPDMLFEEIKRFSKKFEAYVTLKDDYGQLVGVATEIAISDADADGMLD